MYAAINRCVACMNRLACLFAWYADRKMQCVMNTYAHMLQYFYWEVLYFYASIHATIVFLLLILKFYNTVYSSFPHFYAL